MINFSIILDLISETISGKEFEQLDSERYKRFTSVNLPIAFSSDSEMTFEPFYESFLNSNIRTRELEKVKRIHSEILEKTQKVEKKPKRKFSKKSKEDSVAKSESFNVGEGGSNPSTD